MLLFCIWLTKPLPITFRLLCGYLGTTSLPIFDTRYPPQSRLPSTTFFDQPNTLIAYLFEHFHYSPRSKNTPHLITTTAPSSSIAIPWLSPPWSAENSTPTSIKGVIYFSSSPCRPPFLFIRRRGKANSGKLANQNRSIIRANGSAATRATSSACLLPLEVATENNAQTCLGQHFTSWLLVLYTMASTITYRAGPDKLLHAAPQTLDPQKSHVLETDRLV